MRTDHALFPYKKSGHLFDERREKLGEISGEKERESIMRPFITRRMTPTGTSSLGAFFF